jgi:hypothetical protein
MNRESLINRLVERKLSAGAKSKVFCICLGRLGSTLTTKRGTLRFASAK